jgi:serine/threonine protein phosphatase PrpC
VNQDRYLALTEMGLFAVFDGVGGRKAGEVASQTAADTVEEAFAADSKTPRAELIRRAIVFANRDIYELGQTESAYGTMATTVALLHIGGDRATIAHAGDSRVYRLSDGILSRETIDHTDFDDRVRAGLIPQGDARPRDDDHTINRALGVEADIDVELKTIKVRIWDRFLLCTDGVYRHLEDDELARILRQMNDPQGATDEIRRLVLERGADDNLTAIVVHVGAGASNRDSSTGRQTVRTRNRQDIPGAPNGPSSMYREPLSSLESEGRGHGTKDRIHVRLGPEERSGYDDGEADGEEASTDEGEASATRRSNVVIFVLLILVLVLGSFYGGLRSANLFNKKHISPPPSDTQLELGRQAYDRGDLREADQAFSSLVGSGSTDWRAWYWMGRTQLEQRRFAESVRSLEHAAELAPDVADTYVQEAAAYEAMGNRARAIEMLGRYAEAARKHGGPGL